MNILITGSNGFIGKFLKKSLFLKNDFVIFTDEESRDLCNKENWEKFKNIDIVIHLASKTNSLESNEKSSYYLKNNLLSAINALEFCKLNKCKIIFLSSYIYSRNAELPVKEDSEIDAINSYALSKKLIEDTIIFYKKQYKLDVIIIRPSNVFGPDSKSKSFIMNLVSNMIKGDITEINNIQTKRDYIYIDDLIEAIYKSIFYDGEYFIFNVGSGQNISHKELIEILKEYKLYNLNIKLNKKYLLENIKDETLMDIKLIKKEMNWEPLIPIRMGIKKIIDYKKLYPK